MRTTALIVGGLLGTLVLAGLLACDGKTITGPEPPSSPPPSPVAAPGGVAVRLELIGPDSLPPRESVQFTATQHLSDGSTRDVTREASWRINSPFLAVTAGLVTAGSGRGDAQLTASLGSLSGTKELIVVPAGTFRLIGNVTETEVPPGPVVGARVEVTAGPARGLTATTDTTGRYGLYGVSGPTTVRITKDGYQPREVDLNVGDHGQLNVEISLLRPRENVAGKYTLTIEVASECRAKLPEEVWSRTYAADITQSGGQLSVKLSGATFVFSNGQGNRFSGRVEPTKLVFSIGYAKVPGTFYDYFYDFIEQLAGGRHMAVFGTAIAPVPPASPFGTLNGGFEIHTGDVRSPLAAACWSSAHRFTLVPAAQ